MSAEEVSEECADSGVSSSKQLDIKIKAEVVEIENSSLNTDIISPLDAVIKVEEEKLSDDDRLKDEMVAAANLLDFSNQKVLPPPVQTLPLVPYKKEPKRIRQLLARFSPIKTKPAQSETEETPKPKRRFVRTYSDKFYRVQSHDDDGTKTREEILREKINPDPPFPPPRSNTYLIYPLKSEPVYITPPVLPTFVRKRRKGMLKVDIVKKISNTEFKEQLEYTADIISRLDVALKKPDQHAFGEVGKLFTSPGRPIPSFRLSNMFIRQLNVVTDPPSRKSHRYFEERPLDPDLKTPETSAKIHYLVDSNSVLDFPITYLAKIKAESYDKLCYGMTKSTQKPRVKKPPPIEFVRLLTKESEEIKDDDRFEKEKEETNFRLIEPKREPEAALEESSPPPSPTNMTHFAQMETQSPSFLQNNILLSSPNGNEEVSEENQNDLENADNQEVQDESEEIEFQNQELLNESEEVLFVNQELQNESEETQFENDQEPQNEDEEIQYENHELQNESEEIEYEDEENRDVNEEVGENNLEPDAQNESNEVVEEVEVDEDEMRNLTNEMKFEFSAAGEKIEIQLVEGEFITETEGGDKIVIEEMEYSTTGDEIYEEYVEVEEEGEGESEYVEEGGGGDYLGEERVEYEEEEEVSGEWANEVVERIDVSEEVEVETEEIGGEEEEEEEGIMYLSNCLQNTTSARQIFRATDGNDENVSYYIYL